MAEKKESLVVTIKKDPKNPKKCVVKPPFVAKLGSSVEFAFSEPDAWITFDKDSPFAAKKFKPGKRKVKSTARLGLYKFSVTWPENGGTGHGNGSGEVISR